MVSRYVLTVPFCVVLSMPVTAQRVRGAVRDAAIDVSVPGAVVSLLDSAGHTAGRTITDAAGRFDFRGSVTATRIRVLRIGYRPVELDIRAHDTSALVIAMVRLPALLRTISVSERSICPGQDADPVALNLWEQARAGLVSSVVAREASPAIVTTVTYRRELSIPGRRPIHDETRTNQGRTTRPFSAVAPASKFAAEGYMVESNGGRSFFAPDADVLIDESFTATHCLQPQVGDSAHEGQLGLAFAPAQRRDGIVDVTGVIWLRKAEPRLESVDFQYTDLEPAVMRAGAGGRLEFQTASNGITFIGRWSIRIPIAEAARPANRFAPRTAVPSRRRTENDEVTVSATSESGGAVTIANWPDGTVWLAPSIDVVADRSPGPSANLVGDVTDAASSAPVAGAEILLPALGRRATTDSAGHFQFSKVVPVTPGPVVIQVRHVGYVPVIDTLALNERAPRTYALARVQRLDTVTAVGHAHPYVSPTLRAFEERRRIGSGTFIDDSVLRASEGSRLADVLALRVPGLQTLKVDTRTFAASRRDQRTGKFAMLPAGGRRRDNIPNACFSTVYLDGILLFEMAMSRPTDPPPNLSEYLVSDLGAIEFYGGNAAVPVQFKTSECGTLLLWTRER